MHSYRCIDTGTLNYYRIAWHCNGTYTKSAFRYVLLVLRLRSSIWTDKITNVIQDTRRTSSVRLHSRTWQMPLSKATYIALHICFRVCATPRIKPMTFTLQEKLQENKCTRKRLMHMFVCSILPSLSLYRQQWSSVCGGKGIYKAIYFITLPFSP